MDRSMNIRTRRVIIVKATWMKTADDPLGCERFVVRVGFLASDMVINTQATIKPHRVQMRKQNLVKLVSDTPAIFLAEKRDDKECIENIECFEVVLELFNDVVELLVFVRVSPVEELALGRDVVDGLVRLTWDLSAGCRPLRASASAALRLSIGLASLSFVLLCKRAASSEYPISPTSLGALTGRGPACGRCSVDVCPTESPPVTVLWEVEADKDSEPEAVDAMLENEGYSPVEEGIKDSVIQPHSHTWPVAVGL